MNQQLNWDTKTNKDLMLFLFVEILRTYLGFQIPPWPMMTTKEKRAIRKLQKKFKWPKEET